MPALNELDEQIFWREVEQAFARIAADPEESARQKTELELWDRVSDYDFREEKW